MKKIIYKLISLLPEHYKFLKNMFILYLLLRLFDLETNKFTLFMEVLGGVIFLFSDNYMKLKDNESDIDNPMD